MSHEHESISKSRFQENILRGMRKSLLAATLNLSVCNHIQTQSHKSVTIVDGKISNRMAEVAPEYVAIIGSRDYWAEITRTGNSNPPDFADALARLEVRMNTARENTKGPYFQGDERLWIAIIFWHVVLLDALLSKDGEETGRAGMCQALIEQSLKRGVFFGWRSEEDRDQYCIDLPRNASIGTALTAVKNHMEAKRDSLSSVK